MVKSSGEKGKEQKGGWKGRKERAEDKGSERNGSKILAADKVERMLEGECKELQDRSCIKVVCALCTHDREYDARRPSSKSLKRSPDEDRFNR